MSLTIRNNMNKVKSLFSSSNGLGRSVRTTLQAFVGILAFLSALILVPEVQDVLLTNNILSVSALATTIGLIAGLQNAVEKLLKHLFGE